MSVVLGYSLIGRVGAGKGFFLRGRKSDSGRTIEWASVQIA